MELIKSTFKKYTWKNAAY